MKKLLLLLVGVMWMTTSFADFNIYYSKPDGAPDTPWHGIYGVNSGHAYEPGDIAKLINGTYTGKIWLDNAEITAAQAKAYLSEWPLLKFGSLQLNDADLEALASLNNLTHLDMHDASFSDGISASDISSSSVEYIMLPYDTPDADVLKTVAENCNNLKVVGVSENANFTGKIAVYQTEAGHMNDFANTFTKWQTGYNSKATDMTLIGHFGEEDMFVSGGNVPLFTSAVGINADLTDAVFEQCEHEFESIGTYNGTYSTTSNSAMVGKSKIKETINTNAMWCLQNYDINSCILGRGNTEIPPLTFNNSNGKRHLQSITIPDSYTKIGFEAFYRSELINVDIPGSVTEVGEGAFYNCGKLYEVVCDQSYFYDKDDPSTGLTFKDNAFASCVNMKHITMMEGVRNIAPEMFYQCSSLENITIPTTCKVIDNFAFYLCTALEALTVPEGVEEIRHQVFTLSGIVDIYVQAKSEATIPKIYPQTVGQYGFVDSGTFGSKNLNGNNTSPQPSTWTDENSKEYKWMHSNPSTEVRWPYRGVDCYDENGQKISGIGGGNAMITIHYPDEMAYFYDSKPSDEIKAKIIAILQSKFPDRAYEAVDYLQKNYKRYNPYTWPAPTLLFDGSSYDYLSETYMFGYDADDHRWPQVRDYFICWAYGLFDGQTLEQLDETDASIYAWRQLPLKFKASSPGMEVYEHPYDDTWYTMCFPWHMTDEQLNESFNEGCEIAEFVGVEMIKQSEMEYDMVIHFNHIAQARYMDISVSPEKIFKREVMGTHEVQVPNSTAKQIVNEYKFTQIDLQGNVVPGGTVYQYGDQNFVYNTRNIKGYLAIACHPYMIHPNRGFNPGNPQTIAITNFRRIEDADELATRISDETVTKPALNKDGSVFKNTTVTPNAGGNYSFIGNVTKEKEMPTPSYFLAVGPADGFYPKYYRKKTTSGNKWTRYTAIIQPDESAKTNIEDFISYGNASANRYNVVFGEWEEISPTAIEEIVAEAERNNEPVQKLQLNVVYNINGQVVRTDNNSLEGLPKGLYIVNGKKYMVK